MSTIHYTIQWTFHDDHDPFGLSQFDPRSRNGIRDSILVAHNFSGQCFDPAVESTRRHCVTHGRRNRGSRRRHHTSGSTRPRHHTRRRSVLSSHE